MTTIFSYCEDLMTPDQRVRGCACRLCQPTSPRAMEPWELDVLRHSDNLKAAVEARWGGRYLRAQLARRDDLR